jgi:NADPH:quinone reductase-like Zn-dependent oxidoreductase
MKAAAVDQFGPPSVLTVHEVAVPRPGPHEVLIAIDTAGIGSWDGSIRDGSWRRAGRPRFPLVPGVDGAGIVVVANPREFDKLNRHLGNARIRVPIAASYPLGKAAQAHRRLDRERVLGRMVLQVHRGRT